MATAESMKRVQLLNSDTDSVVDFPTYTICWLNNTLCYDAAAESMKRVKLLNSDTDSMVDRRVVVKLLTTFFERGQSPEILQLMTRMLGFSGTRRAAVLSAAGQQQEPGTGMVFIWPSRPGIRLWHRTPAGRLGV